MLLPATTGGEEELSPCESDAANNMSATYVTLESPASQPATCSVRCSLEGRNEFYQHQQPFKALKTHHEKERTMKLLPPNFMRLQGNISCRLTDVQAAEHQNRYLDGENVMGPSPVL